MIVFKPQDIVKKYLGIIYEHRGRSLKGLDCWGLIVNIYRDYGIKVFDLEDYSREWARRGEDLILGNYYNCWKRVNCCAPGDVILIEYPRNIVGHAGIIIERGKFLHATREGVILDRIRNWKDRICGFYRWVGEE